MIFRRIMISLRRWRMWRIFRRIMIRLKRWRMWTIFRRIMISLRRWRMWGIFRRIMIRLRRWRMWRIFRRIMIRLRRWRIWMIFKRIMTKFERWGIFGRRLLWFDLAHDLSKGVWFIHFFTYFCRNVRIHVFIGATTIFKFSKKVKIIFSRVRVPKKIFKIHGCRKRRIKYRRREGMNRRR